MKVLKNANSLLWDENLLAGRRQLGPTRSSDEPTPPLQSVEATRVVAENFFDHRRRYAFLAPHHTHHTIFFGLILMAVIRAHDHVVFANVSQKLGQAFVRLKAQGLVS